MKLQEAINIKINDEVFIIGRDNKVYPKKVIGVQLRTLSQVDITFINPTEKNVGDGYVLSYQPVFLKEKDALKSILDGHILQADDVKVKMYKIKEQIRRLECIENRKAT